MSPALRSRKLRWWTAWLFTGSMLALGFGCSGKSERSSGSGDDDAGGDAGDAGSSSGGSAGSSSGGGSGAATGGGGTTTGGNGGTSSGAGGKGGSGAGGKGGTGTGASAGSATGGASGSGGTTGGGGSAGSGATSGTAGTAGTAGTTGNECATGADCHMVSDCCSCRAEPVDGPGTPCALPCERDPCTEDGIGTDEVACVMGRCVINRTCNDSGVTCRRARPTCPAGTVPSVLEACWGPCLPPTECAYVSECADCGDAVCVEFAAQMSSFACVTSGASCDRGSYCDCLGVCGFCSELSDRVTCQCLTC